MIIKISDYNDSEKVKEILENENIDYDILDEDNYLSSCPNCGDSEFWSNGRCAHCGYDTCS